VSSSKRNPLIVIVLAIGLAGTLWYFRGNMSPPAPEPVAAPAEVVRTQPMEMTPPEETVPLHPVVEPDTTELSEAESTPLPPLDDSDGPFLLALIDTFGQDIESLLVRQALIDKVVATADNLTGSHVSEKVRPVGRLPQTFKVEATSDENQFTLHPDNYRRYDAVVALAARADPKKVVAMYRHFYPLFQESYARLGYPDRYFNDRVIEVIDHLLETPAPEEPVLLVQPHVLYQFANPELEGLSSGQKLLIRMGNKHAETIKQVLRNLRALLVQPAR
jgi:hypothetical protein